MIIKIITVTTLKILFLKEERLHFTMLCAFRNSSSTRLGSLGENFPIILSFTERISQYSIICTFHP